MDDFIDLFAATILNRDFSGLAAGWLLSTSSSNRASTRSLFRDVALRRRFPGLTAGCSCHVVIRMLGLFLAKYTAFNHLLAFLQGGSCPWWEGRIVFGRRVGNIRLHHLLSQPPDRSFDLFHSCSLLAENRHNSPNKRKRQPTRTVFCQLLVSFFLGRFFLFYFWSLFSFQLVKSIGPKDISIERHSYWRHSYWRDPHCLCKGKIKSKSPESLKSKLHRPHFPGSTVPIFQAPPSPFSRLHRPYFPSSAVSIFNL